MTEGLRAAGAVALKFLVVWRPDDPDRATPGDGPRVPRRLSRARPGVRPRGPHPGARASATARPWMPPSWPRPASSGRSRPDVYKTHVPTHGLGTAAEIEARSAELSAAIGRPWVVLSAGVPVERFPDAVGAAGAGGASGFLAGRGVWGPSIRADGSRGRPGHARPAPGSSSWARSPRPRPDRGGRRRRPAHERRPAGQPGVGARRRAGHRHRHRHDQQQGRGLPR